MPVAVDVASEVTDDVVDAFARLIPQLSKSNPPPTKAQLQAIVDHDACHLLLARDDAVASTILGSLTLVVFPIPTATRALLRSDSQLESEPKLFRNPNHE